MAYDHDLENIATAWLSQRRGKAVWSGPPTLATLTTRLLPQSERSAGVGLTQLQSRWSEIVGDKLSTISQPDLLKGDTLVIKVMAAAAPLLTMRKDEIIGLIRLAGASKVKKITLVRGPLSKPNVPPSQKPKRPMDAAQQRELDQHLHKVVEQDLKAALKRLADATSDLD